MLTFPRSSLSFRTAGFSDLTRKHTIDMLLGRPSSENDQGAAKHGGRTSFQRKRTSRKPFPDHAAPESCPCCGSTKLSKLGEDVTNTLVIQKVRER